MNNITNDILECIKSSLRYRDNVDNITIDTSFDTIDLDELDMVEIIIECERKFNVSLNDDKWDWNIFSGTIKDFAIKFQNNLNN